MEEENISRLIRNAYECCCDVPFLLRSVVEMVIAMAIDCVEEFMSPRED